MADSTSDLKRAVRLNRESLRTVDLGAFTGLGTHVLADFHACQRLPSDPEVLRQLLEQTAVLLECTVVESVFHAFSPYGLSGVVVVAESHLAVHTWPEQQAACVDFFTCSNQMLPLPGLELLFDVFAALEVTISVVPRGLAAGSL